MCAMYVPILPICIIKYAVYLYTKNSENDDDDYDDEMKQFFFYLAQYYLFFVCGRQAARASREKNLFGVIFMHVTHEILSASE